ncbi:hypothetical protein ACIQYG_20860 [Peribacillus sp. NPDC096622]|uniref:hypothetical protein n=1 Tax=Peribacillus sp. NPDC096622 TaxID=3364396 RepID=UPI0038066013
MDNDFDHFVLKIEAKPVVFHGKTVKESIPKSLWTKIRKEVLAIQNYKCSICSFKPEENEMRKLHVHEIERYDFENGVCELESLNLICVKCHAFHHMGRTSATATEEYMEELIEHFMDVNECDWLDYESYKLSVMAEQSKNRKNRKAISPDQIKFKVTGDIPYKKEVIAHLKKKDLYAESNEKQMSEHFINFVIKGEKFDFNAFKTQEEFTRYQVELEEFLKERKKVSN